MLPILPLTQALQMRHGARHPGLRRANTLHAIREIAAAELLPAADCATLAEQYRVLRRSTIASCRSEPPRQAPGSRVMRAPIERRRSSIRS